MLKFERVNSSHKDGVLNLMNNHSDWGPVTWEQINAWKISPYEEVIHGVAIDEEGLIIGQIIFTFCRIRYNDELLKGGRILAPIVNRDIINEVSILNPDHPIQQLYNWVFNEIASQSVEMVLMYPNIKWRAILSSFSRNFDLPELKESALSFYSVNCGIYKSFENQDYQVKIVQNYSQAHRDLWQSCISDFQNYLAIERDIEYLGFKAGYDVKLELWHDDKLIGLLIFNKAKNLIYDLFIVSGYSFETALKCALRMLGTDSLTKGDDVKFLGTEVMLSYFKGIDVQKIDYSQLFAWTGLTSRVDANTRWYITSLD